MNIFVILLVILSNCGSTENQNSTEYYKRDNTAYADAFMYESVIMLKQDSFVIAEYKESFEAFVYRGVGIGAGQIKKLIVTEHKARSLNTGQPIDSKDQEGKLEFELTHAKNGIFQLRKYQNGKLDSTFRYQPYKVISQLNDVEKLVFEEDIFSDDPYWTMNRSQDSVPPVPKMLQDEVQLRLDIEELSAKRQQEIDSLINHIADKCALVKNDSIVMSLTIQPNGDLKDYRIITSNTAALEKVKCINEFMKNRQGNLGMIKTVPNARTGERATTITYTNSIGRT